MIFLNHCQILQSCDPKLKSLLFITTTISHFFLHRKNEHSLLVNKFKIIQKRKWIEDNIWIRFPLLILDFVSLAGWIWAVTVLSIVYIYNFNQQETMKCQTIYGRHINANNEFVSLRFFVFVIKIKHLQVNIFSLLWGEKRYVLKTI